MRSIAKSRQNFSLAGCDLTHPHHRKSDCVGVVAAPLQIYANMFPGRRALSRPGNSLFVGNGQNGLETVA